MSSRSALLHGPVARTLVALAWPILVVLALQTFVAIAETWFVSFLGTDALAGVALVFPVLMLMTMMSNGAIGGGVSSAIARTLGAGRAADARSLAWHAAILGTAFGALFTVGVWLGGEWLFGKMGAQGATLAAALLYARVVFLAAIPGWISNLLAASLRGAGNVRVPAMVTAAGSFATLFLSPLFIFGLGPLPAMGVAGAGMAMIVFNLASLSALALYMRSQRSPLRLAPAKLEKRLFAEVLGVGLVSAIGTVTANLTVVVTTGLVGRQGTDAIAGYGLASRLDYLLIPLLFALGTASVTMVGTNIGAGQHARARRIAWTGTLLSAIATGAIGLAAAAFPHAWMRIFSDAPALTEAGVAYLEHVAPFYLFFGAGMGIYFASQGAGRMAWPFGAGLVRLAIVALAGSAAATLGGLYWLVAASYLAFGAITLFGLASGYGWGRARAALAGP